MTQELKKHVIAQFEQLLCKLQKGYKPEFCELMEEISLIELMPTKELDDNLILTSIQYYSND